MMLMTDVAVGDARHAWREMVIPRSRSRSPVVHHALGLDLLALPEHAGLAQHGVDEGRLAVIDVGDDGHVAVVGSLAHGGCCRAR